MNEHDQHPGGDPVPELTAVILTLNEAANIKDCVKSLAWADVLQSTFENYAQQRNAALAAVQSDWVFFVDADERGTPELAVEVRGVIANKLEKGWYVPRDNIIFGKLTRGAGWYPDFQLRLFKHGKVHYERPVHETAVVDGDTGYLENALIHYNYRDKAHFQDKQASYTTYDASILKQQGIRPRPHKFILQPWRQFWWRYVTLEGYKDGWHGLSLSLYMSYYEWVKYWKLRKLWRQSGKEAELQSGKVAE